MCVHTRHLDAQKRMCGAPSLSALVAVAWERRAYPPGGVTALHSLSCSDQARQGFCLKRTILSPHAPCWTGQDGDGPLVWEHRYSLRVTASGRRMERPAMTFP